MVQNINKKPTLHVDEAIDADQFGQCIVCYDVITGEVWMCPQCSSLMCCVCLHFVFVSAQNKTGCPKCRIQVTKKEYVRCRPIE